MKAWKVSTDCCEATILVWAATAARAKTIARQSEWLCDEDWTDLWARREPKADGLRKGESSIDASPTPEELRIMRNLGWYEVDGNPVGCEKCGKTEWQDLPESKIGPSGLCVECQANAGHVARPASGVVHDALVGGTDRRDDGNGSREA